MNKKSEERKRNFVKYYNAFLKGIIVITGKKQFLIYIQEILIVIKVNAIIRAFVYIF